MSVLDLRKAYLQVHVHHSLWSLQTVLFKEQMYCLTHMGFRLNVALSIMWLIVEAMLSAYIDDVYVNNSVAPAERVRQHLP